MDAGWGSWRRAYRPAVVAFTAFGLLGVLVLLRVSVPGDADVLRALRPHRHQLVTDAFLRLDEASESVAVAAAAAVVAGAFFVRGRPRAALLFALAVAVPLLANPLVKLLFTRPRPSLSPVAGEVSRYSFPAGHAVAAVAFFGGLALVTSAAARRWLLPVAAVMVCLIGFGQLYLGRHYPTDLLGGWALAATWLLLLERRVHGTSDSPRGSPRPIRLM